MTNEQRDRLILATADAVRSIMWKTENGLFMNIDGTPLPDKQHTYAVFKTLNDVLLETRQQSEIRAT